MLKRKQKESIKPEIQAVPQTSRQYASNYYTGTDGININQLRMYESLRKNIPIIDAAICKTAKLIGGCEVVCKDPSATLNLNHFLNNVQVNGCGTSLETFLSIYLEQLLTFGTAVGEIVTDNGRNIAALYNASLEDIELKANNNPLDIDVYVKDDSFGYTKAPYKDLILLSTLSPQPGKITGQSILEGLPFVSEILQTIYRTLGVNWDRVGNVRFAVTYQPGDDPMGKAYTKERASALADEWRKAMATNSEGISDFVAVGDVSIKVIGADNQILDSEVPVKQMLEQIVSKLSVPPFLLGLSWSSTERMAQQQTDIFTSELQAYRRSLNPIISKICSLWLKLNGYEDKFEIVWSDINLQDAVELANARLINARASEIEENEGGNKA